MSRFSIVSRGNAHMFGVDLHGYKFALIEHRGSIYTGSHHVVIARANNVATLQALI